AGTVLLIGRGNEMERMNVALAAWQQLGLDGCLIGHKNEANVFRMWGLGVRLGPEIYLFDPWKGAPLFAADGKRVVTLREARSNPELLKSALAGVDGAGNLKQWIEQSSVYLSPPIPSLSLRMRFLQTVLSGNQPVIVSINAAELQKRFASTGERVAFWNPPND